MRLSGSEVVRETEDGTVEEIGKEIAIEEEIVKEIGIKTSPLPAATLASLTSTPRAEGAGDEVLPLTASHPPIVASVPQGHDDHGHDDHDDSLRGLALSDALNSLSVADVRFTTPTPSNCPEGSGNRSPYMFRPLSHRTPASDDHES